MEDQTTTAELLKKGSITHLREGMDRIERCLKELDQEEIWQDHNENLVSVGNLILHLAGNVGQYVVRSLGGIELERQRSEEFRQKPDLSSAELLDRIGSRVDEACRVIDGLDTSTLNRPMTIQGFEHTGTSALLHAVEHFSYHVGQITFATKYLKNRDLGYYSGLDLERG